MKSDIVGQLWSNGEQNKTRRNNMPRQRIGIITRPIGNAGLVPLSNLIDVIRSLSDIIYVITGGDGMILKQKNDPVVRLLEIKLKNKNGLLLRISNYICAQVQITINLLRPAKSASIWIFFLDSHSMLLVVLAARLLRKKTFFLLAASIENYAKAHNGVLPKVSVYSERITFKLSNRIIVYTPNLIKVWGLEKYQSKISIAHEHVLDLDNFNILKDLSERDNLVGYIGRLSEEKGPMNFVHAISELSRDGSIKFIIGGSGRLLDKIRSYLKNNCLNANIELIGWIPHTDLPPHLNNLRLLVVPSYSEGLPNIMLEAMACGTPVLATPVGAIPDIIADGDTGFLMENNSPECIASNVIRALEHPDLKGVAQRARSLVEREFTFERAVEGWRAVLEDVHDQKR